MSEILFKSLTIENFLSIGEGSIDLANRGLLLIQGQNNDDPSANSNGAGKSSTVDALCWVLYGTTARGLSGDNVVNRFEGKNCLVEITFTLNGKTYKVARHRKHSKGKNRLLFTCDGADLTLGTDKLTQDSIEKTIGCGLEVFTASIYSGQNSMPNLPAMTDKELKLLVEKAAGIELLDAAYDIARERHRTAKTICDIASQTYTHCTRTMSTLQAQELSFRENKDRWDVDHAARVLADQQRLVNLTLAARKLKDEIEGSDRAAVEANIAILEADLLAANKPLPEILAPERAANTLMPAEDKAWVELRGELVDYQRSLADNKRKLRSVLDEVRNIDATIGTPCGECGKEYHKEDLGARRAILATQARDLKKTIDIEEDATQVITDRSADYAIEHATLVDGVEAENAQKLADYNAARKTYQNALQARRDAIASSDSTKIMDALKSAQSELQSITNKQSALASQLIFLRSSKEQLDRLKLETNPHAVTIEQATKNVVEAEETVQAAQLKMDASEQKSLDAGIVVETFSPKGMRGEVLDSVTPFLNARTAQYLGTLSDGSITAEWKTVGETGKGELREKFHIAVTNINGADVYEGNSGGEQRKVRISTAMALQDLVASRADRPIKLFIADEADDALDVSGLERLMAILEEKARHVGTVLVISHNDLECWIPSSVTVMKSGGKSHIVEM